MRIRPQIDQVSVVLLGSFNPAIFLPNWFAQNKMIGEKESGIPVRLQTREELEFETGNLHIRASLERFEISSVTGQFEHVKDLLISCFGTFLPHTPVHSMGINRCVHFDTGDFDVRDRVGSRLAPKEAWGEWGKEIEEAAAEDADMYKRGGMTSITMLQKNLQFEGRDLHVQARVEPSLRIGNHTGIFVDVVNHFNLLANGVQDTSSATAVRTLEANWESSLGRAETIFDQVMKLAEECRQ